MTFGYKLDQERKIALAEGHAIGLSEGRAEGHAEGTKEATIIDIGKSIVMLRELNIPKNDVLNSISKQYPDYSEVIMAKMDEIYVD